MKANPSARDFMVTSPVTVSPKTDIIEGIRLLLRNGISGAPVVDEERRYLGMLSEKCCLGVLTLSARLAAERGALPTHGGKAGAFMTHNLVTFRPDSSAFEAIEQLLSRRISGAPVVDDDGRFLGVFSEKLAMNLLLALAYDQLPTPSVRAFTNTDQGRVIDEDMDVFAVAQMFLDTPYRRLPVLRGESLVGQVSRRDVLLAEHHLSADLIDPEAGLIEHSDEIPTADSHRAYDHGILPSTEVASFMDYRARTINESTDLLQIAHTFKTTPYRRLPVLREGKLVGLVSRRDVLTAALRLFEGVHYTASPLYLSAVLDSADLPAILST